jgi:hypothetical protein
MVGSPLKLIGKLKKQNNFFGFILKLKKFRIFFFFNLTYVSTAFASQCALMVEDINFSLCLTKMSQ